MLIEFRVENFRSLRDEQVLTFEAATIGDDTDLRPRTVAGHDKKLLPAAVLYGANASGKTNMLAALGFMREAVMFSYRLWDPASDIPRSPFAWGERRNEPSFFEVLFLSEGTKYEYGFTISDKAVEEEWLFAYPNGRKQKWFERERMNFTFGEHLKGQTKLLQEVTRMDALFLSVAPQHGLEQLMPIYIWFHVLQLVNIDQSRHAFIQDFLRDVRTFTACRSKEIVKSELALLQLADRSIVAVKEIKEESRKKNAPRPHRYLLQHQAGNDDSWLELSQESKGTQAIFWMAETVVEVLSNGGILLADELESSLHPLLGQAIVELFNNPVTNPKNAQLLFTTHDTNLLGNSLGEPVLRRDQIWLAEKDRDGASVIYPLTDYKPRKAENLERGYLQGRYGAIPFLGDFNLIAE